MSRYELLPCPFCGGNARLTTWTPTAASISCIMCGAHFNTYTEAEAIEAWNTRAERTCTMEPSFTEPRRLDFMQEYRCTECGGFAYLLVATDDDRVRYCPNCGKAVER